MNERLRTVAAVLDRLSARERFLVAVLAALVFALAAARLAVLPALDARRAMARRAEALSRDLGEIVRLASQIERLERENEAKGPALPKDFSLFGFVEKAAARSVE
ncbi:MAG: hypothetical protein D6815_12495, partial [Candidatus Dadabacteria bacterium]